MCPGSGLLTDLATGTASNPQCFADSKALGGVGLPTDFLEIHVDLLGSEGAGGLGVVRIYDTFAAFTPGVFIDQTADDLQIHTIDTKGDVSARTESGDIVDARTGSLGTDQTKIFANTINLWARHGSIGDPSGNNDLEFDSQHYVSGGTIGLRADDSIYATETSGDARVVLIQAFGNHGHQPYTVRFTVRHSSATSGEDLNLLASGSVLFAETGPEAVPNGFINTPNGSIELRVGDNVNTDPNAQIVAGNNIDIYGDYARVNEASSGGFITDSSDPGYGSIMHLAGVITPGTLSGSCASEINPGLDCNITRIFGNEDGDTFNFDQTHLGGRTFV